MSIKTKLLLVITGTLVVVGLGMGLVIYWQNNQKLTEHSNVDIKNTISYTSQLVNFYIGRAENNLTSLANDPIIINALENKDPATLLQASEKMTVVNNTTDVLENIGLHEIIDSTCILVTGDKDVVPFIGADFSKRDYCQGIIKTKESYLSSAYISVVSNSPVLGLVVPVRNENGEMLGYILGSINLIELRGYLWDLQKDSAVDLLDRYGALFLTTEEKIETLENIPSSQEGEVVKIQKSLSEGKKEGYFKEGGDFIGYKSNGVVTIIYEKSPTEFLALTNIINFTVFLAVFLAIVLTALIIYLFVGTITKRISRLSKITQEIAGGKFDIKLEEKDLKAKDEAAVLARAFNVMATKLQDIYKSLEEKVKERTKEVEEKNKKLVVSEAELKKALDIAEQTNKLMVGRELKMKELKEEIKKLGRETTYKKLKG